MVLGFAVKVACAIGIGGALAGATAGTATAAGEWTAHHLQERVNVAIASAAAANQGATTVWIPPGDYYFYHDNFNISKAHNLSVLTTKEGNVTLWFSGTAGVNITHSTNVVFGGGFQQQSHTNSIIVDYDPPPPPQPTFKEKSGITLQLYNCTRIVIQEVVIRAAPFMAVTAFQGGGDHTIRRVNFIPHPNRTLVSVRDALHFSDLRKGPTIVDSIIGFTGDDFFNVHSTLLLVLKCQYTIIAPPLTSTTTNNTGRLAKCLLVNPRVMTEAPRNTVYGTFSSALQFVVPEQDGLSFYAWPQVDMVMKPFVSWQGAMIHQVEDVSHVYGKVAQQKLPPMLEYPPTMSWHEATNQTTKFDADEVWKVVLELPNETDADDQLLPPIGSIVAIDTIASAGAKIINNTFLHSQCNMGRFKSPGGILQGNNFLQAWKPNLELTALPQWFEGPVDVRDVLVADNVFVLGGSNTQTKTNPIHCGPLCENSECHQSCHQCPTCDHDTAWARNITLRNNTFVTVSLETKTN